MQGRYRVPRSAASALGAQSGGEGGSVGNTGKSHQLPLQGSSMQGIKNGVYTRSRIRPPKNGAPRIRPPKTASIGLDPPKRHP
eukprot:5961086-Prymnesium_polylepis.3